MNETTIPYATHTWEPVGSGYDCMLAMDRLREPESLSDPARIICCTMADLFHRHSVPPPSYVDRILTTVAMCPQHRFLWITDHAANAKAYFDRDVAVALNIIYGNRGDHSTPPPLPLPNLALLVRTGCRDAFMERVPILRQTNVAVRGLSCEPLIEPVADLLDLLGAGDFLDWVTVGGESRSTARPCQPDWIEDIWSACRTAGVPFYFNQWGRNVLRGHPCTAKPAGIMATRQFPPALEISQ